jgi:GTPase SAR1 family protein
MSLTLRPRGPSVISAIVGRHGVGKTSLIQAFSMPGSGAPRHTSPTIGAAVISQMFAIPESMAHLAPGRSMGSHTIWDTAGQERYASLVPMYTRNCDILLIALPADEDPHPETIRTLLSTALPPIRSPKVIKGVLTKCDLVSPGVAATRLQRLDEIIRESPQAVNRQFEVHTYATSACNNEGVEECFQDCVPDVFAFKAERLNSQLESTILIDEPASIRSRCGMCQRVQT